MMSEFETATVAVQNASLEAAYWATSLQARGAGRGGLYNALCLPGA